MKRTTISNESRKCLIRRLANKNQMLNDSRTKFSLKNVFFPQLKCECERYFDRIIKSIIYSGIEDVVVLRIYACFFRTFLSFASWNRRAVSMLTMLSSLVAFAVRHFAASSRILMKYFYRCLKYFIRIVLERKVKRIIRTICCRHRWTFDELHSASNSHSRRATFVTTMTIRWEQFFTRITRCQFQKQFNDTETLLL